MESTNIKVSTIQFVEEQGEWSNGQQTFLKYKLHLNNGEKPEFLAKSKKTIDSFNQGDEVRYSYKKEGQSFAKIVREENNQNYNQMAKTTSNKTSATTAEMTQQESISRSVGWNNVAAIQRQLADNAVTSTSSFTLRIDDGDVTGVIVVGDLWHRYPPLMFRRLAFQTFSYAS